MKERIWIVASDNEGHQALADEAERRDLIERGYGEFRIDCTAGAPLGQTFHMYVEGWPRDFSAFDVMAAASNLLAGCEAMQAYRPDGSAVLP